MTSYPPDGQFLYSIGTETMLPPSIYRTSLPSDNPVLHI